MKDRDTVFKILKAVTRDILGLPEEQNLQFTTSIVHDLGADSLDTMELVLAIEEEFDIEIQDDEARGVVTIEDAVRLVGNKLNSRELSLQDEKTVQIDLPNLRPITINPYIFYNWDKAEGKDRTVFVKSYPLKDKIIILNAPPSAGKDTVADFIANKTGCVHTRFKEHLYQCAATLFNVDLDWFKQVAQDTELKEQPNKLLTLSSENFTKLCNITKDNRAFTVDDNWNVHITPREALIFTSEVVIKPVMGEEYFGQQACGYVDMAQGTIFSDGGFQEELLPLILKYGQSNIYVIQFTRKGSESFEGDSRNWLDVDVLLQDKNVLTTENNSTIEELAVKILEFVTK